ncbi:MAG: hypothetical protein BWY66_02430 [bacterium ADurb.Bin374]|nr:MAG: hypothetical protein BWY66_02430 [bacterium ADurb.Bin374]
MHRLGVAHFADEDDVGVFAQGTAEGVREIEGVGAELALGDRAALVRMDELTRGASDEDQTGPVVADLEHDVAVDRQLLERRHDVRNDAEHGRHAVFLHEHIGAETSAVMDFEREVQLHAFVEHGFLRLGQQGEQQIPAFFGRDRLERRPDELAMDADARRQTDIDVEIRATLLVQVVEEFLDVRNIFFVIFPRQDARFDVLGLQALDRDLFFLENRVDLIARQLRAQRDDLVLFEIGAALVERQERGNARIVAPLENFLRPPGDVGVPVHGREKEVLDEGVSRVFRQVLDDRVANREVLVVEFEQQQARDELELLELGDRLDAAGSDEGVAVVVDEEQKRPQGVLRTDLADDPQDGQQQQFILAVETGEQRIEGVHAEPGEDLHRVVLDEDRIVLEEWQKILDDEGVSDLCHRREQEVFRFLRQRTEEGLEVLHRVEAENSAHENHYRDARFLACRGKDSEQRHDDLAAPVGQGLDRLFPDEHRRVLEQAQKSLQGSLAADLAEAGADVRLHDCAPVGFEHALEQRESLVLEDERDELDAVVFLPARAGHEEFLDDLVNAVSQTDQQVFRLFADDPARVADLVEQQQDHFLAGLFPEGFERKAPDLVVLAAVDNLDELFLGDEGELDEHEVCPEPDSGIGRKPERGKHVLQNRRIIADNLDSLFLDRLELRRKSERKDRRDDLALFLGVLRLEQRAELVDRRLVIQVIGTAKLVLQAYQDFFNHSSKSVSSGDDGTLYQP